MASHRQRKAARQAQLPPCDLCPLRHRTVCRDLTPDERGCAPDKLILRRGEVFTYDGDPLDSLTVVFSGLLIGYKMLADGRRQVVELFFPGDVVCEETGRASFTVEAATDAALCRYLHSQLAEQTPNHGALSRHLLQITERELFAAHDLMLTLSRGDARERVAFLLLRLSAAAEARGERASPIWLPLSRETIGDHLGLTMETTSRVLSGFRRDGLIAQGNHDDWIELRDRRALQQLAGREVDRQPEYA